MKVIFPVAALAAMAGGCAYDANEPAGSEEAAVSNGLPGGATTGPDGYWTISAVPPSPYPETVPADPSIGKEDMFDVYARENGLTRAEAEDRINGPAELHTEMDRIAEAVRKEPNFVELRMVRDPAARMEAWFTKDAAATLARYTESPHFIAREGGISSAAQEALRQLWLPRLQKASVGSMSVDPFTGKVELGVGMTEAEFLALARKDGWDLSNVTATYAQPQPAAFVDPAIARWIRAFPREHGKATIRLTALYHGTIVLEDGCFRLQSRAPDDDGKLVLFSYRSQLALDDEGYLVVRSAPDRTYRIGEPGAWGGPNAIDPANPEVKALHRRCGEGEVFNVAEPESARLFSLPFAQWVTNYAKSKGLTRQKSWGTVIDCMKREEAAGRIGLNARDACIKQFN